MKLKLLDLFSGIGGFSLGLESTGYFETIAFVEKNKFCQKVLKKNFPNITIESEVRDVKGEKYKADVVTAGFPCQPFSVAGKRKGKDDDRYLWDETIRVIRECKCKWFIGENVEGIINIANGTILQQIQQDLEKEGFQVQCVVIPASGIGAWHVRKRVFIIANSSSQRSSSQSIRKHRELEKKSKRKKETGNQSTLRTSSLCADVPNTKSISSNERKFRNSKEESREKREVGSKIGRDNSNSKGLQGCSLPTELEREQRQVITKRDTERQQTWWETQSKLCGVPDGISYELDKDRNNRLKALGNSIVPLIARELGLAIMKAENDEKI